MSLYQDPQAQGSLPAPGANGAAGIPTQRPYQVATSEAVCRAFFEHGQNRLLVKKPTGTGKTVWFANLLKLGLIEDWLATMPKKGASMLVIAHREELLTQAQDKIQRQNPGLMVAIEQADNHASKYADVVIASIQTLAARRFTRLKRLLQHHKFRIVIVDEAHHAAAASYRTALVHLGFLPQADASESTDIEAPNFEDVAIMERALHDWDSVAPKDRLLIGVTATPNRTDAIGLGCVFQTIAYSYALKQAIEDGWLAPIKPWVIETQDSLDAVRTTAGDFNQKDLAEAVNNQVRNQLAVAGWQEHAPGLPTLAFTVDVAHAHALAAEFVNAGIRAEALSGETPKDDRRRILRQYTAGQIDVITNCMVLTEGTDLPLTRCILHAKPTKSATLYEQMTGRGLRIFPGKTECIVLDVVDIARRHSLQASPVLYGLPPGLLAKGEDLKKIADEIEALQAAHPAMDIEELLKKGRLTLAQLRATASTFNIWTVPELGAFGESTSLNWIRVSSETYRLSYPWADGYETIQVDKDLLGKWQIVTTLRPQAQHGDAPKATRQKTIAMGIETLDAAAVSAEAFMQQDRRSVAKLKSTEASWRLRPASPKQIGFLKAKGVPHDPKHLTMGGASDLIDLYIARRR